MRTVRLWIRCVLAVSLIGSVGCGARAKLSVLEGTGANPVLPPPDGSLIPLVHVVNAKGWAPDETPDAAPGSAVVAFARDLDHPRWMHVLPNGDVLVAETNAPPRPDDGQRRQGMVLQAFQKKAGGAVPSAESHHAAARCRRRRRRRNPHDVLRELEFAVRHGAGWRRAVRRQYRRACALSVPGGRHACRRRAGQGRGPPGRHAQPSLDQEHDRHRPTARGCMRRGFEQQRRRTRDGKRGRAAPRSGRSI